MLKPLMVTIRDDQGGSQAIGPGRSCIHGRRTFYLTVSAVEPGIILDKCIACSKCVKACPNQCIKMVQIEHETLGKVKRPEVNVGRCMMCGNCAEVCPTNAMIVTPEFDSLRTLATI